MRGGDAPKHYQSHLLNSLHIDHQREPPEIVYSGGDRPIRGNPAWMMASPVFAVRRK